MLPLRIDAQVTSQRLAAAASEPQNWLTYSGNYASTRFTPLAQITPANVKNLKLQWVYQSPVAGNWQTTPLVVDGVMYLTQRLNDVVALDAATGRAFWIYRYTPAADRVVCCGANNRGLAILGNTLFMATLDAQLIAIDAKSGRKLWQTEVATTKAGYSMTLAPLVVKDKVIVGVGGGEYGIRGFVAAYDANTGKEAWRFYTIPAPGEPGSETWERCPANTTSFCDPEAWKHGGGSIWLTGSYDPQLNLTYWGVGNVGPDYNGAQRPGDNLYTDSVVALDADTGRLRWHYQFTPHDVYDYDSVQIAVLADNWANTGINVMLWANRNGNYYVLDRATGRFLLGKPFVKVNWMSEFDRARPADTDAAGGGPADLPGQPGRHELVLAVLQPADPNVLHPGVGGLRQHLHRSGPAVQGREQLRRRRPAELRTRPQRARPRPLGHQHLDRSRRPRRGDRSRLEDRRAEVEVPDDRRHRQRDLDDGVGPALYRRPRGLLPGARRAHRRAAVEDQPRRGDQQRPDVLPRRQQAVRVDRVWALAVGVRARRVAPAVVQAGPQWLGGSRPVARR